MRRSFRAAFRNWALACAVATLVTAVLFFMMTQLIPSGGHTNSIVDAFDVRLADPKPIDEEAQRSDTLELNAQNRALVRRLLGLDSEDDVSPSPDPGDPAESTQYPNEPKIDWYAAKEQAIRKDGDDLKRWRLEQGFDKYVSIMQGPPPKGLRPSKHEQSEASAVGTSYRNAYGETEVQVSEHCVAQQPSMLFDHSDFARHIGPRIFCKTPPAPKLEFRVPRYLRDREEESSMGPDTFSH